MNARLALLVSCRQRRTELSDQVVNEDMYACCLQWTLRFLSMPRETV